MSAGRVEGGGGAAAADRTGFWGHVAGAGPGSRLSCGGRPRSQTCSAVSCRVRQRQGGGLGKAAARGAPPQRQKRSAVDRTGGPRRTACRPLYSDTPLGANRLWFLTLGNVQPSTVQPFTVGRRKVPQCLYSWRGRRRGAGSAASEVSRSRPLEESRTHQSRRSGRERREAAACR